MNMHRKTLPKIRTQCGWWMQNQKHHTPQSFPHPSTAVGCGGSKASGTWPQGQTRFQTNTPSYGWASLGQEIQLCKQLQKFMLQGMVKANNNSLQNPKHMRAVAGTYTQWDCMSQDNLCFSDSMCSASLHNHSTRCHPYCSTLGMGKLRGDRNSLLRLLHTELACDTSVLQQDMSQDSRPSSGGIRLRTNHPLQSRDMWVNQHRKRQGMVWANNNSMRRRLDMSAVDGTYAQRDCMSQDNLCFWDGTCSASLQNHSNRCHPYCSTLGMGKLRGDRNSLLHLLHTELACDTCVPQQNMSQDSRPSWGDIRLPTNHPLQSRNMWVHQHRKRQGMLRANNSSKRRPLDMSVVDGTYAQRDCMSQDNLCFWDGKCSASLENHSTWSHSCCNTLGMGKLKIDKNSLLHLLHTELACDTSVLQQDMSQDSRPSWGGICLPMNHPLQSRNMWVHQHRKRQGMLRANNSSKRRPLDMSVVDGTYAQRDCMSQDNLCFWDGKCSASLENHSTWSHSCCNTLGMGKLKIDKNSLLHLLHTELACDTSVLQQDMSQDSRPSWGGMWTSCWHCPSKTSHPHHMECTSPNGQPACAGLGGHKFPCYHGCRYQRHWR